MMTPCFHSDTSLRLFGDANAALSFTVTILTLGKMNEFKLLFKRILRALNCEYRVIENSVMDV